MSKEKEFIKYVVSEISKLHDTTAAAVKEMYIEEGACTETAELFEDMEWTKYRRECDILVRFAKARGVSPEGIIEISEWI